MTRTVIVGGGKTITITTIVAGTRLTGAGHGGTAGTGGTGFVEIVPLVAHDNVPGIIIAFLFWMEVEIVMMMRSIVVSRQAVRVGLSK